MTRKEKPPAQEAIDLLEASTGPRAVALRESLQEDLASYQAAAPG